MPGARMRPQPRMQKQNEHTSVVTTVTPVSPGIPRAIGFNGLPRGLPGEPGFVASVACGIANRKLDTSVGVSGRHDFAVRLRAVRLSAQKRPSHPAANVRDDRETPLVRRRDGSALSLLLPRRQEKFRKNRK